MDYSSYFKDYTRSINNLLDDVDIDLIDKSVAIIRKTLNTKSKIYIIGNGGSASIDSHVSVDFAKVAGVPSSTFNNSNLITCFAKDYSYENWVTVAIKAYCNHKDLIILISSSGTSQNIVNAGRIADSKGNLSQYPTFTQGGNVVNPDSIKYNFDNQKASIWNSKSEENGMNILSTLTKKQNDSVYYLKDGKVTTGGNLLGGDSEEADYFFKIRRDFILIIESFINF